MLRRATLEARGSEGVTPLADAAVLRHSNLQSPELLLDAEAITEVKNARGSLALTHAIFEERVKVVRLLLHKGAKPQLCNLWSPYGSLLAFTMTHSSLAVLRILLKHFDKVIESANDPLPEGIPTPSEALKSAIRHGNTRRLDTLIESWTEIDDNFHEAEDEVGTALHYAARYGSVASIKWIWAQPFIDSDVNKVVGSYGTSLQAAIGAVVNVDKRVAYLLEWGVEVSKKSGRNGTALNTAAGVFNFNVAEVVLNRLNDENINIVAGQWGSPIEALLSEKERSAPPNISKTKDMIDLFVSKGVSAALRGGFWHTALHAAAHLHGLSMVRYLLEQKDVSKDERDRMGRLPLHLAAMRGYWEMVKELSSGKSTIVSKDY